MSAAFENDGGNDLRGERGGVEIGSALEAMRGVCVQAVPARGAANGDRIEPGGFYQYVGRGRGDHRVPPTHDSGQSEGLGVIGDDQVFRIESALYAVESPERFALAGTANDDAPSDF